MDVWVRWVLGLHPLYFVLYQYQLRIHLSNRRHLCHRTLIIHSGLPGPRYTNPDHFLQVFYLRPLVFGLVFELYAVAFGMQLLIIDDSIRDLRPLGIIFIGPRGSVPVALIEELFVLAVQVVLEELLLHKTLIEFGIRFRNQPVEILDIFVLFFWFYWIH